MSFKFVRPLCFAINTLSTQTTSLKHLTQFSVRLRCAEGCLRSGEGYLCSGESSLRSRSCYLHSRHVCLRFCSKRCSWFGICEVVMVCCFVSRGVFWVCHDCFCKGLVFLVLNKHFWVWDNQHRTQAFELPEVDVIIWATPTGAATGPLNRGPKGSWKTNRIT